jgi:hypothetical protein
MYTLLEVGSALACIYKLCYYNNTNDDTNDMRLSVPFSYYCLYITMTQRLLR